MKKTENQKLKEEIKSLTQDRDEYRSMAQGSNEQIKNARKVLAKSQQEKESLQNRLDAALYAMCLMRNIIVQLQVQNRKFEYDKNGSKWEEVKLAI